MFLGYVIRLVLVISCLCVKWCKTGHDFWRIGTWLCISRFQDFLLISHYVMRHWDVRNINIHDDTHIPIYLFIQYHLHVLFLLILLGHEKSGAIQNEWSETLEPLGLGIKFVDCQWSPLVSNSLASLSSGTHDGKQNCYQCKCDHVTGEVCQSTWWLLCFGTKGKPVEMFSPNIKSLMPAEH